MTCITCNWFNSKTSDRAFYIIAPTLWNDLASNMRKCYPIDQFKRSLKFTYSKEFFTYELWQTFNIVAQLDYVFKIFLFIYYSELF